ncbi:unnamed protein product [Didymodactylos carnosus]|uniref:CAP-Gly domain-containing protein n=1 Tax=Didymodactylos carnosus TaxID=1234261 RepID=A0A813QRA9_9BILA|nr:unnamed protein product [Didymodactylos carnosus]CAF0791500.1 unnamed protein product [Didymodactylos carnosus]CAF3553373.1 unnamed protein product [Didymodactylos carnosus]CAF3574111.1 unnamed protein product [Didymodactylos carnosus]
MLTYDTISVGQRVEVLHNNQLLLGTIAYKGPVVSRKGIWLGIDLSTPDGDNNGCLYGRVYFRAPPNYGLFTTIENVRLATDFIRKSLKPYRTINKKSEVDEALFGNTDPPILPQPSHNSTISQSMVSLSLKNPRERAKKSAFDQEYKKFPLPQSLVKKKVNDKLKKKIEKAPQNIQYSFAYAPSIPQVFMPPSEVDRVKWTGFEGQHSLPRYTVVSDQYDFFKLSCPNDIS